VPEQFLNELQIARFLVDYRGRRVAECVETSTPAVASNPETIQRWIVHVTSEHIRILEVEPSFLQNRKSSGPV
jgi:hypothetical protein